MRIVATFSKPEQAHLLRAHLEGSGVAAFVRDDLTVAADWALSNAIGGVKVEVAEEDYDEALSVIAAFTSRLPSETVGKRPNGFGRYMKVFMVVFIVVYGFLAWRWAPAPMDVYGIILIPSLVLSACVAGIGALLEL